MQYSTIGATRISRIGLGTKRLPVTDATRVLRLDTERATEIADKAVELGINYLDTSYSDAKGEAEAFLGGWREGATRKAYVATSYFDLVDPRYEYVFQKQLKKLNSGVIDFYYVESVCDLTRKRDIDSGAIDFLFQQREAGTIAHLGFSSELSPEYLKEYLKLYPWDFVRLRINYYDWYLKGAREQYVTATEACTPVVAHGPLRVGPRDHLKPEARALLAEAAPDRSETEWALRFVKNLDNVRVVTCNAHSAAQLEEDVAPFQDDLELDGMEMHLLGQAARKQQAAKK